MRFLSKVSLMRNLDIFTKLEKMWLSSDGVLICWIISNIKWRIKTGEISWTRWCSESQPRYLSIITHCSHSLVYSLVSGHFFTEIGPSGLCLTESPSDWLVGEISWQSELKISRNHLCCTKHSLNCQFQLKLSLYRVNSNCCQWFWVSELRMLVI